MPAPTRPRRSERQTGSRANRSAVVAWRRIDPRHLRQRDPHGLTVAYTETGGRDAGHLLLTLDADGGVLAFELTCERFLSGRELFAGWSREQGLRVGEVDAGRSRTSFGPRVKPSSLVRYYSRPPAVEVAALLAYVAENRAALPVEQYDAVTARLRAAADEPDG